MRLAVISPFVDRQHGTERALAELLERLATQYNCEIHLYAQRIADLPLIAAPKTASGSSGVIIWHRVPAIPGPHLLQFLAWICWCRFSLWSDIFFRKLSFDLVLSPGINGMSANVVIVHALFHRLQQLAAEESRESVSAQVGILRRLHRRLYYAMLSGMERCIYSDPSVTLIAVSQRISALLSEYFQRKDVHVIPNGVDSSYFSQAARVRQRAEARQRRAYHDEHFVLLLIGNDWGTKGLETVLESMTALKELPLRLLVVGGDNPSPFQTKAQQLGIQDRCNWELPGPNVMDFYSAADLYVSPSREDSFGLPVVEAMACGLPVITSVFAGVSDIVRDLVDGFVLSDPHDAQALAKTIETLFRDGELRQRIGMAAAETVLHWNWDRNAASVWGALKEAAERKLSVTSALTKN